MKKVFFGVFISALLIACSSETKEESKPATTESASVTDTKKTGDEILNMSEADEAKNSLQAFAKGDVAGMTAHYDDNAKFYWSSGDSLVGKKGIQDYYNGRWKVIDSVNVIDQVVLPVKVNTSQAPAHATGKWVLVWSNLQVKYKNGKTIRFWTHADYHYNDAGKVDVAIQYIDRHQILEATKGM
jgi:SnoaL-like domain